MRLLVLLALVCFTAVITAAEPLVEGTDYKTLVAKVNELEQQLNQTKPGSVLFYAKWLATKSPGNDANLVYEWVYENVGSGYDKTTGIFTVPVAGTYSFNVQHCSNVYKHAFIVLVINDEDKNGMLAYGGDSVTCRSFTYPATLKVGNTVRVKVDRYSDLGEIFYQNTANINAFSGVLLG